MTVHIVDSLELVNIEADKRISAVFVPQQTFCVKHKLIPCTVTGYAISIGYPADLLVGLGEPSERYSDYHYICCNYNNQYQHKECVHQYVYHCVMILLCRYNILFEYQQIVQIIKARHTAVIRYILFALADAFYNTASSDLCKVILDGISYAFFHPCKNIGREEQISHRNIVTERIFTGHYHFTVRIKHISVAVVFFTAE